MAQQVDIGIITIRDDEFRAVLSAFPQELGDGTHRGKHREYALRQASAGKAGHYSLAIVRLPEQGNGEAQDAARDMLEDLEPSLLLVVGIAGGLPSEDLALGDVVLSTRIHDYSVEARKEGSEPAYAMTGGPIARQILGGIANLPARAIDLGDWAAQLSPKPAVNWRRRGQLYGPDRWQKELRAKLKSHYGTSTAPRTPTFQAGPIASSDRLIKDPRVLFPWIQTARNLLAVEMESGGVYRAARDRCPMLAIRALSDIVGLKRDNDWTKYAAEAAAAFTRAYLQTCPVPLRSRDDHPVASDVALVSKSGHALSITGSHVEAASIVVGDQHIHNSTTTVQLEALAKLVEHDVLDAAKEQLDALERSSWASMTPADKSRHRKLQGTILARHGQNAAGAARYMEAADFAPGDEKAQVLRVHALMLRDDITGAHELAGKLVMQYPSLASAKACWITTAPKGARSDDLLAKPWDGVAPEIASALANRLLSENRPKEALEVLQRAHSPDLTLPYWSTYSLALLKYQEQLGGENGPPELLAEALTALDKAYKLWRGDAAESKQGRIQVLHNMAYVHRLRGDLDEEWRVLREACEIDPSRRDIRARMGYVLMQRGRNDEAIAKFEALLVDGPDGPDYVPFLLGAALAKRNNPGDMERAAELFERTAKLVQPSEPLLRLDGAEGLVKSLRKMKQWDRALAACKDLSAVLGGFLSAELEAGIHLERGDTAAAHRVLVELASSDLTDDQRRALGVLLQQVGDSQRAYALLEPVAPRNVWNAETAALLAAAQATGRNESTIRICRQLREGGVTRSSIVEAEAVALQKRGELAAAIAVVEHGLVSHDDPFLRVRLSLLGIASNRPELIEKDPGRLPKPGDGAPLVAALVVNVLRAAGDHETAIRYAYDAYRANRSDADGWRAIIDAFLPISGPTNHVEPSAVAVDAAVLIREGKNRRWIIVEESEPEAEHDELPPGNPLVTAMLGKKVGDSFELTRGSAPPRVYWIEEIRSKYVQAYRRCLEQWEEQFPNIPGPVMFELPDNPAEQFEVFTKQLLPMLEKQSLNVKKLEQLYQNEPVTLHMLASGLNGTIFCAMCHLINQGKINIHCTRAQPDELNLALAALKRSQKIILETSALSTLLLLEEFGIFFECLRGQVAIAQSTLDELRAHRRKAESSGSRCMGVRDGNVAFDAVDENARVNYLNTIDVVLSMTAECEVFCEATHEHFTPDEWDRLVNIGGAGAVESLHRAIRTGEPVWCDDMVLAFIANERRVRVVWTQLMSHHLALRSAMTAERAYRISAKLVGCRFVQTKTAPQIYLEAARLATWNPDRWPLRQHLQLFEVEPWGDSAAVSLAASVLRYWWHYAPSDAVATAVMIALLERIAARTNASALLDRLDRILERAFGVDVLSYQRASAAMEAWKVARPLVWVPS